MGPCLIWGRSEKRSLIQPTTVELSAKARAKAYWITPTLPVMVVVGSV